MKIKGVDGKTTFKVIKQNRQPRAKSLGTLKYKSKLKVNDRLEKRKKEIIKARKKRAEIKIPKPIPPGNKIDKSLMVYNNEQNRLNSHHPLIVIRH